MSRFYARYSSWAGLRTSMGKRMSFFITHGLRRALRSKWAILVLVITYGLIVMPRVFAAMNPFFAFDPLSYFSLYDEMQLFIMLYAAVIGAGIIASDFNDKSIVLYFTKGFSKAGYAFGKLSVLFLSFSLVTILPLIVIFAVALISSDLGLDLIRDNIWVLAAGLSLGLLVTLLLTTLTAGLSSLLGDVRYAGASIFAIFFLSRLVSEILLSINGNEHMKLISLWDNLSAVGTYLFRLDNPYGFPQLYPFLVIVGIIALSSLAVYYILFKKELSL
ncbi:MAG: ABC transporter permease subunit [Candidatus Methanofastidiosa archaeon]|nr:ABC transporter permease subunit [Candidatus Methanofastidiosa archaeon]